MKPNEVQFYIQDSSLKKLCADQIWNSIMENTAWCGWTEKARSNLVDAVVESVHWAIDQKIATEPKKEIEQEDK